MDDQPFYPTEFPPVVEVNGCLLSLNWLQFLVCYTTLRTLTNFLILDFTSSCGINTYANGCQNTPDSKGAGKRNIATDIHGYSVLFTKPRFQAEIKNKQPTEDKSHHPFILRFYYESTAESTAGFSYCYR